MTISHALIAYKETVLAEASIIDGSFRVIARRILPKLSTEGKKSFTFENHNHHVLVDDEGLICICRADKEMSYSACFEFLHEIYTRFLGSYQNEYQEGLPESYNDRFARTIKDRMDFYSNDRRATTLTGIEDTVKDVKNKMTDNIELSLGKNEEVEKLKNKAGLLRTENATFRSDVKAVSRDLWCKNAKMWIVMFIVFAVRIFFLTFAMQMIF